MRIRPRIRQIVRRLQRGSSLVELIVASAVLVVGLLGVVALLTKSATDVRAGVGDSNAMTIGATAIDEVTSVGYDNIVPTGVSGRDGGFAKDESGRNFGIWLTILDAGTTTQQAYSVTAKVEWAESVTKMRSTIVNAIVVRPPDGGP